MFASSRDDDLDVISIDVEELISIIFPINDPQAFNSPGRIFYCDRVEFPE